MSENPLSHYVSQYDKSFHWVPETLGPKPRLNVVSQTWMGVEWRHSVVVCLPRQEKSVGTWSIHVTGGDPNDFDVEWSQGLADLSGAPVAILFNIPNQPLWGMSEDDLIAHTFEQFLLTGDDLWPLLLPMVKSVVRTMDALQEFASVHLQNTEPQQFVVFGASKRGWTSWLSAAINDPRVAGIAPMLFDHLNMPAQLRKQFQDWGHLSPMIVDYTSRGLEGEVDTNLGHRLVEIVDPYSYLKDIEVPVFAILGSKDAYWTVDASDLYWNDIPGPAHMLMVPNLHHAFELTEWWTPTLARFVDSLAAQQPDKFGSASYLKAVSPWTAHSESRVFTDCEWRNERISAKSGFIAHLEIETYEQDDASYSLSTRPTVEKIS